MKCPDCGREMQVYNSILADGIRYRRYLCRRCGCRVSTREIPEAEYQELKRVAYRYERLYTTCCVFVEKWEKESQKLGLKDLTRGRIVE